MRNEVIDSKGARLAAAAPFPPDACLRTKAVAHYAHGIIEIA